MGQEARYLVLIQTDFLVSGGMIKIIGKTVVILMTVTMAGFPLQLFSFIKFHFVSISWPDEKKKETFTYKSNEIIGYVL